MKIVIRLLIVFSILEIAVLLLFGKLVGSGMTLVLLLLTGVLGAYLTKRQGIDTIRKAQLQLQQGNIPGGEIRGH